MFPLAFDNIVTLGSGDDIFLEIFPVIRSIWTHYQGLRGYTTYFPSCYIPRVHINHLAW